MRIQSWVTRVHLKEAEAFLNGLQNLQLPSVTRESHVLLVRDSKSGDERKVPVLPRLAQRLRRLPRKDAAEDRLFVGVRRSARSGLYEPLDDRTVQNMIKSTAEEAGLTGPGGRLKRVWPHLFRHSFTSYMLQKNVTPGIVVKMLGHRSASMVMEVYSHFTDTGAAREIARALRADEDE